MLYNIILIYTLSIIIVNKNNINLKGNKARLQMHSDKDSLFTPIHRTYAIGKKFELIPGHVTKILYRQGEGPCARIGCLVNSYYSCYLVDGTEITKRKNTQRRLPVGSNRLIEGLQIGLLTARRHQKFTLIISPQYGYVNIQYKHIVPPGEKLIFEFQIISIDLVSLDHRSQIQVLSFVKNNLDKSTEEFQNSQFDKSLQTLSNLEKTVKTIKFYKHDIMALIYLKHANILYYLKRYKQAEAMCLVAHAYEPSSYRYLRIYMKIEIALKNKQQVRVSMNKIYDLYGSKEEIIRMYVEFLKSIQDYQLLWHLPGYDYKKDKIQSPTSHHRKNKLKYLGDEQIV